MLQAYGTLRSGVAYSLVQLRYTASTRDEKHIAQLDTKREDMQYSHHWKQLMARTCKCIWKHTKKGRANVKWIAQVCINMGSRKNLLSGNGTPLIKGPKLRNRQDPEPLKTFPHLARFTRGESQPIHRKIWKKASHQHRWPTYWDSRPQSMHWCYTGGDQLYYSWKELKRVWGRVAIRLTQMCDTESITQMNKLHTWCQARS